ATQRTEARDSRGWVLRIVDRYVQRPRDQTPTLPGSEVHLRRRPARCGGRRAVRDRRRLRRGPGLRRMRVRERVVHRERGGPEEGHHDLDVDDEHLVEHVLERQLEQLDLHYLVDIDDETDDHLYLHLDLGDDDLEHDVVIHCLQLEHIASEHELLDVNRDSDHQLDFDLVVLEYVDLDHRLHDEQDRPRAALPGPGPLEPRR